MNTTLTVSGHWDQFITTGFDVVTMGSSSAVEFVNFNGNRDAGVGAGSMTLTSGTPFETTSWTPSGSSFGFAGLYLYAPIGYSVSDPIAATLVIAGDPYSIGGGFTGGGTYSDGGMNSVTWSVVPEPSSYATLLGILCLGCAVLRRRRP